MNFNCGIQELTVALGAKRRGAPCPCSWTNSTPYKYTTRLRTSPEQRLGSPECGCLNSTSRRAPTSKSANANRYMPPSLTRNPNPSITPASLMIRTGAFNQCRRQRRRSRFRDRLGMSLELLWLRGQGESYRRSGQVHQVFLLAGDRLREPGHSREGWGGEETLKIAVLERR